MYRIYVGEQEVYCDDNGHPELWGNDKAYYSGENLEYIGERKVYRDNNGKAIQLGTETITRDSTGKITAIGGSLVSGGDLNLD